MSDSHNNHFVAVKKCVQCHGTDPTTSAHINGSTSINDAVAALQDEAGLNFADIPVLTDYTIDANNVCTNTSNNGLGCHATGTPDWDVPFASTGLRELPHEYDDRGGEPDRRFARGAHGCRRTRTTAPGTPTAATARRPGTA